ncbi:hypothetical protein [uncultured Polaribacter sp.]|uniref:hypothetical protein n=1 Tax=uncultured Polaribacter sp. TaxID=174711 RepID=UPI00263357AC|nr:hypothetical protein [uncultured Polaribacter sp.]
MKKITLFLITITALLLYNCSNSDDNIIDVRYSVEDLEKIHGNSSKTWKVENFYQDYEANILSDLNDCYKDDVFTFFKNTGEVKAELGTIACFGNNPTEQYATFEYTFYAEEGRFFLNVSRGESFNGNFKVKFFILELEELEEDKMIFTSGEAPNYGKTIVFKLAI